MTRPALTLTLGLIAASALASSAAAATTYPVELCAPGTETAGLWQRVGVLTGNVQTIECAAAAGQPSSIPTLGANRGVAILPPLAGITASTGNPSADLQLTAPAQLTIAGGTIRYRAGTGSMAWRATVRANGTTIAGCRANASTGADACPYSPEWAYFERAGDVAVPVGTTSLSVGLTCEAIDVLGQPNAGCSGSSGVHRNAAYAAIVGGQLLVEDRAAPTGSATLTQTDAAGNARTWTRRADARLRIQSFSVADAGRGVCSWRVAPASAPTTTWDSGTVVPQRTRWRQCDSLTASAADVSTAAEGTNDVQLLISDGDAAQADANETIVGSATIRVDETPPTIVFPLADGTQAAPGQRIRVAPAVADQHSGLASSSTSAVTSLGAAVSIDQDGFVTVPAGATVVVTTTATDNVGLSTTSSRRISAPALPPDDPPTPTNPLPEDPAARTVPSETVPTAPTPPTEGATPPHPGPALATPTTPNRVGSAACRRSRVSTPRFSRRKRLVSITGCRAGRERLRVDIRVQRGNKTIRRTVTVRGRAASWRVNVRLRRGDIARSVRLRSASRSTAWRTVRRTS